MLTAARQEKPSGVKAPFDTDRLDGLMEDAGLDVILATSKHNVQYLMGGHRALFFDYMDAMGVSRYLPVMVYPKGAPDKAAYFGHRLEGHQKQVKAFWTPTAETSTSGSVDAVEKAIAYLRHIGLKPRRVGAELGFLPLDAGNVLRAAFPDAELADAVYPLERLRMRKTPEELALLRKASDLVIESMEAVIANHGPGATKRELVEALRREEVNRGLTFEYCLIAAGASHNRAPSEQRWEKGDVLSIDSGGNYQGYIGDVARMAIQGEPDSELVDLLAEVDTVQQAAFKAVRAGAQGGDIYVAAERALAASPNHNCTEFVAHGMGLVSHEAPHLTASGPVPYSDEDARRPLETGMIISVETTILHPRRGFIKLEDTIAVTDTGYEMFGTGARGWNRGGIRAAAR
ncbi:MAG TPA: Xaa-Pro peptidase family protein [Xanthobacteraceae bacterium]|nr:Xaa-Pro peptidase family protein [Xanthobacteraceae bacterium]